MPIALRMPALSPTMKDGTLARWCVKEGDKVEPGSLLAEVETDKALMEFECADEGVVARLLVEGGAKNVPVNKVIAVLAEEGEGKQEVEKFIKENTQEPELKAAQGESSQGAVEQGESLAAGAVEQGESLAVAAVVEPPSVTPAATPWARRLAENHSIPLQNLQGSGAKGKITAQDVNLQLGNAAPEYSQKDSQKDNQRRIFASPRAKARAKEASLGLENIVGSGEQGRIVYQDVEKALQATSRQGGGQGGGQSYLAQSIGEIPAISPLETPFEMRPHTSMREVIAKKLTLAKNTIPHFYLNIACNISNLVEMRQQVNQHFKKNAEKNNRQPLKVSINDLLVKALALALERRKDANVAWQDNGLKQFLRVDVAVAVAIQGGLITPIIRDAAKKPFQILAQELHYLIEKARAGKLKPQEYNGGTISISNLGMFGIQSFQAVINPPQAAILAVGAVEKILYQNDDKSIVQQKRMIASLSADHRAIDGAVAAKLCAEFKSIVENPIEIILG